MEERAGTKIVPLTIAGPGGQLVESPFLYGGEDCVDVFLGQQKEEKLIELLNKANNPMNMSNEEEAHFQA